MISHELLHCVGLDDRQILSTAILFSSAARPRAATCLAASYLRTRLESRQFQRGAAMRARWLVPVRRADRQLRRDSSALRPPCGLLSLVRVTARVGALAGRHAARSYSSLWKNSASAWKVAAGHRRYRGRAGCAWDRPACPAPCRSSDAACGDQLAQPLARVHFAGRVHVEERTWAMGAAPMNPVTSFTCGRPQARAAGHAGREHVHRLLVFVRLPRTRAQVAGAVDGDPAPQALEAVEELLPIDHEVAHQRELGQRLEDYRLLEVIDKRRARLADPAVDPHRAGGGMGGG